MAEAFAQLRRFYPFDQLEPEQLALIAESFSFKQKTQGDELFRESQKAQKSYYLLSGEVSCHAENSGVKLIQADDIRSRYPLSDSNPRRYTATVKSALAQIGSIDRLFVQRVLVWDQLIKSYQGQSGFEKQNIRWLAKLFRSPIIQKIPVAHLKQLLKNMEAISVLKGEAVIEKGQEADCCYILKSGRCLVTDDHDEQIAVLEPGAIFGVDALISASPRNATVKMTVDGTVCRLTKSHFMGLLKQPALSYVRSNQAAMMLKRSAWLLDVRQPHELKQKRIRGARNLPFASLREYLPKLSQNRPYILCCEDGQLSSAAGYILKEAGFKAAVLQGGLTGLLPKQPLSGTFKSETPVTV